LRREIVIAGICVLLTAAVAWIADHPDKVVGTIMLLVAFGISFLLHIGLIALYPVVDSAPSAEGRDDRAPALSVDPEGVDILRLIELVTSLDPERPDDPEEIEDVEEPFSWGLWVSQSRDSFERYIATYDEDQSGDGSFGWLSVTMPGYDRTEPDQDLEYLGCDVRWSPRGQRPLIVPQETGHPLYRDVTHGMSTPGALLTRFGARVNLKPVVAVDHGLYVDAGLAGEDERRLDPQILYGHSVAGSEHLRSGGEQDIESLAHADLADRSHQWNTGRNAKFGV